MVEPPCVAPAYPKPTPCSLQASNMLWIRRGWEVTVAALQSSVNEFRGVNPGSRGAFWPNHITKNAAAHPFYKALTAVGPRRQVWHYHDSPKFQRIDSAPCASGWSTGSSLFWLCPRTRPSQNSQLPTHLETV